MKINKNNKSINIIKAHYFLLILAIISQTMVTCVKLGQTISCQHKLQRAQSYKKELQKENEDKQAQYHHGNSLLANQIDLDESYIPISSALVISTQNTLALR